MPKMKGERRVSLKTGAPRAEPSYSFTSEQKADARRDRREMAKLPSEPGAYMSSADRSIFLLDFHQVLGWCWRFPGGTLVSQSNPLALKGLREHLPLRPMVPRRRKS